jgi:hypothetical protein
MMSHISWFYVKPGSGLEANQSLTDLNGMLYLMVT